MIILSKKQWEQLEKKYPICIRNIFRPPLWAVKEGMVTQTKYQMTLDEIALLEQKQLSMKFMGKTPISDDDYVAYYISDDNKLYQYLYREQLEFIGDDENFDVIHTDNWICELICVNESEDKESDIQ